MALEEAVVAFEDFVKFAGTAKSVWDQVSDIVRGEEPPKPSEHPTATHFYQPKPAEKKKKQFSRRRIFKTAPSFKPSKMPRRRRRRARRRGRKKRFFKSKIPRSMSNRVGLRMPKKMLVTHVVTGSSLPIAQTVAGTAINVVMGANTLLTTGISGYTSTDNSPATFTEMLAFYTRYLVVKSSISMTVGTSSAAATAGAVCGIYKKGGLDTPTTKLDSAMAMPGAVYRYLPGGYGSKITLRNRVTPSRFLGLAMNDDTLQGTGSSDPGSEVKYVFFHGLPGSASTSGPGLAIVVRVKYLVVWSRPAILSIE